MSFVRIFIGAVMLLWLANCGGVAEENVVVTISPVQPFVFDSDRSFVFGIDIITFDAPNTQFQIQFDNKGNALPITVIGANLQVTGFKGTKSISVDPLSSLAVLNPMNGQFNFIQSKK
jgi:hypothetical protein